MIKKFFMLVIALFLGITSMVNAHSVLKSSTPKVGQVVTDPLSEITLSFNTKVEKGSRFYVVNNVDKEKITPGQLKLQANKISGIFNNPLDNGYYTLKWEIIGADGHPVKGNFPFQVKNQSPEKKNDVSVTTSNENERKNKSVNQSKQRSSGGPFDDNMEKNLSPYVLGMIILLTALALIILVTLLKRKE